MATEAGDGVVLLHAAKAALDRIDAYLRERGFEGVALANARARATAFAQMAPHDDAGTATVAAIFCGEAIAGTALERDWVPGGAASVVEGCAEVVGASPDTTTAAAFAVAVRNRWLFELPPRVAGETQLKLLCAFSRITESSVWLPGESQPLAITGGERASRRARQVAQATLAGERETHASGALLHGVPIVQWDRVVAALVVRCRVDDRVSALGFASEAALALAPIVDRLALLERNADREQALVSSSERRLVRLGFDLHDGPLQDIAALSSELRLLASQLRRAAMPVSRDLLAGRVDDLVGRVAAIETDTRELARSLETARLLSGSLSSAVRAEAERASAEGGVHVATRFVGSTDGLSDSQRIAILRLVEAALENVRQHSGARNAVVSIESRRGSTRVAVTDDGRGFDVESTLVEAARAGRLGLVGMGERIRLLGGRLDITSAPGGPTSIVASLPRWQESDATDDGRAT